jgi:hypothetical protein
MRTTTKLGISILTIVGIVLAYFFLKPPQPIFVLENWEVTADRTVWIEFTYKTNKRVELVLIDPRGREVSRSHLSAEATRDSARLTPFEYVTPPAGTYRMLVNCEGKRIFEKSFKFSGAKIEIGEVRVGWRYEETLHGYVLDNLSIELVNSGDLPAYCLGITGTLDEEGVFWKWVGKYLTGRKTFSWKEKPIVEEAVLALQPGDYKLTLKALGTVEESIAERTVIVHVP